MKLNPEDPVERIFIECVEIYRERSKKYTDEGWDDNFRSISEEMKELFPEFTPADAARTLIAVKNARLKAGRSSGRKDFEDDSFRDGKIDKINYSAIELALEDQAEGEKVVKKNTSFTYGPATLTFTTGSGSVITQQASYDKSVASYNFRDEISTDDAEEFPYDCE